MARGTANGEPINSQAATDEFREGYDRTFGDKPPERGRWVMVGKHLVKAEDYRPPERAVDAPVLSGRFYEDARATDGTDIGSRQKYRNYCKRTGVTASSDFSPSYYEGIKKKREAETRKERREVIARRMYEIDKP